MITKNQLRKDFLAKRKNTANQELNKKLNNLLCHFLKQNFRNAIIGGYYPISSEANILPTINNSLSHNLIGLPIIEKDLLKFYQYTEMTKLRINLFNIAEPINSVEIIPSIILTPIVAADLKGNRLGYGKGYYDKYFASRASDNMIKIGICYNDQIAESIPVEPHDIRLDLIITEDIIYEF